MQPSPSTTRRKQKLECELASLVRVRNRLALNTTDVDLGRILTALLPRALSKLRKNSCALQTLYKVIVDDHLRARGSGNNNRSEEYDEYDDFEEPQDAIVIRKKMQSELTGLLLHAMERMRGLRDMIEVAPLVEALASFLSEDCVISKKTTEEGTKKAGGCALRCEGECVEKNNSSGCDNEDVNSGDDAFVANFFALSILEICIPRCCRFPGDESDGSLDRGREACGKAITHVMQVLDFLHRRRFAAGASTSGGTFGSLHRGEQRQHLEENNEEEVNGDDFGGEIGRMVLPYAYEDQELPRAVGGTEIMYRASWVFLDLVCASAGVDPLSRWENLPPLLKNVVGCREGVGESMAISWLSERDSVTAVVAKNAVPVATAEASQVASEGGFGVMDLFLDILLYWPRCCDGISLEGKQRILHRLDERLFLEGNRVGIAHVDDDSGTAAIATSQDLIKVKLACLRYAVSPVGRGLFNLDRALVLLVSAVGSVSPSTVFGRVATSYLNAYLSSATDPQFCAKEHIIKRRKASAIIKGRFVVDCGGASFRSFSFSCTMGVVCSLLVLVLGDEVAGPILLRHLEVKDVWEDILGPRPKPTATGLVGRGRLAVEAGSAVVDFVSDHFPSNITSVDHGICSSEQWRKKSFLFADLVLAVAEEAAELMPSSTSTQAAAQRRSAAVRMVLGLCRYLVELDEAQGAPPKILGARTDSDRTSTLTPCPSDSGMDHTFDRSLYVALNILSAAFTNRHEQHVRAFDQEDEDGERAFLPRRRRRDGDAANQAGRGVMARGEMVEAAAASPKEARSPCYLIVELLARRWQSRKRILRHGQLVASASDSICSRSGKRPSPFKVPILLFECLIQENDRDVQSEAAIALECLLELQMKFFESESLYCASMGGGELSADRGYGVRSYELERFIAPLLPPLLSASCSESEVARLVAARWVAGVVRILDPLAAAHLCSHLVNDADTKTSAVARSCLCDMESSSQRHDKATAADDENPESIDVSVAFLDLSGDADEAILRQRLNDIIRDAAETLDVPKEAAFVLLRRFQFSLEKLDEAIGLDRDGTLELCGVQSRCGRRSNPPTTATWLTKKIAFSCGVCLDEDISSEEVYAMPCGHEFCLGCWRLFLEVEVGEGKGENKAERVVAAALASAVSSTLDVVCPHSSCREKVTEVEVAEFAPHLLSFFNDCKLVSFIDLDRNHRPCPGADCTTIATAFMPEKQQRKDPRGRVLPLLPPSPTCPSCQTQFCFCCGEPQDHAPAKCHDVRCWKAYFSSSKYWITKHTKPCPSCHAPIEKNRGCNHMRCTKCDGHFCWLCMKLFDTAAMVYEHDCNRYSPQDNDDDRKSSENDNDEGRKLFFSKRFIAHDESERFARKVSERIGSTLLMCTPSLLDSDDVITLEESVQTLAECRQFLKYSYVSAYFFINNATTTGVAEMAMLRDSFEDHQATLETFAEKLSFLVETDLEQLRRGMGLRWVNMHMKSVHFHAVSVKRYMQRFRKFVEEKM